MYNLQLDRITELGRELWLGSPIAQNAAMVLGFWCTGREAKIEVVQGLDRRRSPLRG
jgi:hypothetical protein